jgi:hypothetical protein
MAFYTMGGFIVCYCGGVIISEIMDNRPETCLQCGYLCGIIGGSVGLAYDIFLLTD